MLYDKGGRSIAQRAVVQVLQSALLAVGVWITVRGEGSVTRQWLLIAGMAIMYARMTFTMFHLLKRAMGWEEALSVPFAFAIYYVGFGLLGRGVGSAPGILTWVGVALFVIGSFINTGSEVLRDRWKADPSHQGMLYTGGLFRYAVHVNYFGDLLWVLGLASITGNPWAFLIPVALFFFFVFYNAPMLDRHLQEKYGEAFTEYRAKTANVIPFIL